MRMHDALTDRQLQPQGLYSLAQDFVDGRLWFGVLAGGDKLLLNSDHELLTLDKVPEGLTVKDAGFDLCRLSKDAILHFLGGGTVSGFELLAELRHSFTRFAIFRDKRIPYTPGNLDPWYLLLPHLSRLSVSCPALPRQTLW
jgi:hypothetical protein